ncbi:MAG: hypothetical protein Q9165_008121 [Trypethelium subeluteriae]
MVPGNLAAQAVAGTKAALEAAEQRSSVKRGVIASSTSALRPYTRTKPDDAVDKQVGSGEDDDVPFMTAESRNPTHHVPDDAPPVERYVSSKSAAQNFVEGYVRKHNPRFSIVNIIPGNVIGPGELPRTKTEAFWGGNIVVSWLFQEVDWNTLFGFPEGKRFAFLPEAVSCRDTVDAHVNALDTEKVPGKLRNFLLCCEGPKGPVWADAEGIVRRNLPDLVDSGAIPFKGSDFDTIKHKFDAKDTESDLLGRKFDSYEKMVTEAVRCPSYLGSTVSR